MKNIIYSFFLCLLFPLLSFAQSAKYDGDWQAVFEGVGIYKGINGRPDPDSPVVHGYGKRIYRIRTIDGITTVRAKIKHVAETDYSYYHCVVTSCSETSLNWYTQTAHYNVEGIEYDIRFFCELTYKSGTLRAYTYYIQNTTKYGHTTSKKYGEKSFTLYKNEDDW